MPPNKNNQIELEVSVIRAEMEQKIRDHRHDGNSAQQINYPDIFDLPVQYLQFEVLAVGADATTGDGKYFIHIPTGLDGLSLVEVHALVAVAGVTGTLDVQIANVTDSVDMLSTKLTIDTTEVGSDTAATPAVINASNSEIQENDILRVDVDAIHSGTAAKGLYITLGFK